MTLLLKIL